MTPEARRLLRALGRDGRKLRRHGDGWSVHDGGGDLRRRPLLQPSRALVAQLIAAGYLLPDGEDACVAARDVACGGGQIAIAPVVAEPKPVRRFGGGGFAGLARRAARGDGPLSLGQARAGLRLQADVELSETGSVSRIDWMRERAGGGANSNGGLPPTGRAAAKRLHELHRLVKAGAMQIACAACVEGLSLKKLEQRCKLPPRSGGKMLGDALEQIRKAYDDHMSGGDTADICL